MSIDKIRVDAEEAWRGGGGLYIVRLTQMPQAGTFIGDDDAGVAWHDRALSYEERRAAMERWQRDNTVNATRMNGLEGGVRAITDAGWVMHSISFGSSTMQVMNSPVTLPHADVAFVRPTVAS